MQSSYDISAPSNSGARRDAYRRLADYALEKGTDPAAARRARAEADFQTRRASRLAPDNEEVRRARDEVVRLLQPTSA